MDDLRQPTDEPTEADPGKAWAEHMRLSLAEVLGADEVEQWAAMDDPGAQRWHLLVASHEKLRALVGGRSAAPTRDCGRPVGAFYCVRPAGHDGECNRAYRSGRPAGADNDELALHVMEAISDAVGDVDGVSEATDAVVALLSRPAAEPPEGERTLAEARSLMRTARSLDPTKPASNELLGQVFGDLIELLAPDGVAAEPNEEPTPWQESPMAAPRPEPFDDWRKDDRTL